MEDPENEEFDTQDAPVAVAEQPVLNGNHPKTYDATTKVNVQFSGPQAAQQAAANLMGRVNNRIASTTRDSEKTKDDREWLDTFMTKPEAGDYQLAITRNFPPTNADGDTVPVGIDSKHLLPVMFYDELPSAVAEVWGGGRYRVTVSDTNGRRVDDITRCILLDISTAAYPAKRVKYEKVELPSRTAKNATVTPPADDEVAKKNKERELILAEQRLEETQHNAANARREREFKQRERELKLQQLEREMSPRKDEKSAELALLEKRLEEERLARIEATARADAERKEAAAKAEAERKEAQHRYEIDKKDAEHRAAEDRKMFMDGLTKLSEKIADVANKPAPQPDTSTRDMIIGLAPVLTAMITKPPPDNKELFLELNKQSAKQSETVVQLTSAMLQSPKTDPNAASMQLVMKMMENDKSGKDSLLAEVLRAFVSNKGETLGPKEMLELLREGKKDAMQMMEMTRGGHGEEDGEEGGGLGIWGRILQAIAPQAMQLAAQIVGNKKPSDQQLTQAVYQMEQQGMIPQQIAPNPQYQLPAAPQYAPTDVNAIQPGPRPMPPRVGPPQPNPAQVTQSAIANEMEGAPSGLPSNGDPEQAVPPTAEELADDNLRDAVTKTVDLMIAEAKGKPQKRVWPEDATANWNADFIKRIVDCQFEQGPGGRLFIIGSKCDATAAAQLQEILRSDVNELNMFWANLRRFVDMNMQRFAPAQTPVQPTPPPVTQ